MQIPQLAFHVTSPGVSTVAGAVETRWYLDSPVANGDLGKLSTRG
jgi:hypothetical protein